MVMLSAMAALLAAANTTPVTIEIVASGHVETAADRYRITGSLLACAATQAAADALLAQKSAALGKTLAGMGVTKARAEEKVSLAGLMGAMSSTRSASDCNKSPISDLLDDGDGKKKEKPAPQLGASANLAFDAPDRATADRAITALKAADAKPSDKVTAILSDDTAAKRAAKQQALAKARQEADAYAAPLGLGGAVLTRISEKQDWASVDYIGQIIRTIGLTPSGAGDKVSTDVTLTVEFRLDPK